MTVPGVQAEVPGAVQPSAVDLSLRSQRIPILLMVAVLLIAPFLVYPVFVMRALCFALFACAFNLLIGYAGLLSFGHALFFGGAAYAAAHAARVWGLPFELSLLWGTAVAAVLGLVVGAVAIRRQGIYFAMITLALAQMFYFYCLQTPFTGGEDGIQNVPRGKLLGLLPLDGSLTMYFWSWPSSSSGSSSSTAWSTRRSATSSRPSGRTNPGRSRSGTRQTTTN